MNQAHELNDIESQTFIDNNKENELNEEQLQNELTNQIYRLSFAISILSAVTLLIMVIMVCCKFNSSVIIIETTIPNIDMQRQLQMEQTEFDPNRIYHCQFTKIGVQSGVPGSMNDQDYVVDKPSAGAPNIRVFRLKQDLMDGIDPSASTWFSVEDTTTDYTQMQGSYQTKSVTNGLTYNVTIAKASTITTNILPEPSVQHQAHEVAVQTQQQDPQALVQTSESRISNDNINNGPENKMFDQSRIYRCVFNGKKLLPQNMDNQYYVIDEPSAGAPNRRVFRLKQDLMDGKLPSESAWFSVEETTTDYTQMQLQRLHKPRYFQASKNAAIVSFQDYDSTARVIIIKD